jgi:predicted nucleic acid-binding protein
MKRLLFDVNVVLDVLLDRKAFADESSAAWAAVERGDAEGLLSAHALTTLHYLNAKTVGNTKAAETTEALLSVFEVAPVDEAVLRSAVALRWKDFEDAVTAAGARRAKCDAVITRNPRDFKGAPVRVLTPAEAVAWIETAKA